MFRSDQLGRQRRAALSSHLTTPLYRDGYAILASGAVGSIVGIVYWALAARLYPAGVVGFNTAVLSAMQIVSGLGQANMSAVLPRYLPVMARARRRLVAVTYAGTLVTTLTLAVLAALVLGHLVPSLGAVGGDASTTLLFVAGAAAWTIFTLQDSVLTGLGRAVWVPAENLAAALIRLALLVALVQALPRDGILASWVLSTLALLPPVAWLIWRRLRALDADAGEPAVTLGAIARVLPGNNVAMTLGIAAGFAMPLLVVGLLSPQAGAYFYAPWSIFLALQLVCSAFATSLLVAGSAAADRRDELLRAVVRHAGLLLVPVVAIVCALAPQILAVFGPEYADEGSGVLRLLALASLPNVLVAAGVARARLLERPWSVAAIHGGSAVLGLGASAALLEPLGLAGAGLAWLLGQSVVAAVVLVTYARGITP